MKLLNCSLFLPLLSIIYVTLHQPFPLHCFLSSTWYTPLLTLKGNYCMSSLPVLWDLSQSKPVVSCIEPCLTVSTLPVDRSEALGVCSAGACIDVGVCMCVCLHVWVWMWTCGMWSTAYIGSYFQEGIQTVKWLIWNAVHKQQLHASHKQPSAMETWFATDNVAKKKKHIFFFIMCRFNFLVVSSIPGDPGIWMHPFFYINFKPLFQ